MDVCYLLTTPHPDRWMVFPSNDPGEALSVSSKDIYLSKHAKISGIHYTLWPQCTNVTDRRTDRRTLTSYHKREMYILHLALKIVKCGRPISATVWPILTKFVWQCTYTCTRLQNYTIGASLKSVSVSVLWNLSLGLYEPPLLWRSLRLRYCVT